MPALKHMVVKIALGLFVLISARHVDGSRVVLWLVHSPILSI